MPLTRYEHRGLPGQWYAKDEADARITEKDAHIADLAARLVQRERDISDDTRTIAMLEARIAELSKTWTDEDGNVWRPTTAHVYAMTRKALRAAKAERDYWKTTADGRVEEFAALVAERDAARAELADSRKAMAEVQAERDKYVELHRAKSAGVSRLGKELRAALKTNRRLSEEKRKALAKLSAIDAARADAESNRVNAERYDWLIR